MLYLKRVLLNTQPFLVFVFVFCFPIQLYAFVSTISLQEAENRALNTNYVLKAATAQANAASETADAQFAPLLPLWTIHGKFQYNTHVPNFSVPGFPSGFEVSAHTPYNFGTTLSYTIWDSFTNLNAYKSARLLSDSQTQSKDNTTLELLLQTRLSYLLVQLALQELQSIENSLNLVRSQFKDIDHAYKAGAVARLDWIDSQRNVLSYQLQYEKERANVELKVKDLYAILTLPTDIKIFKSEKGSDESVILNNDLLIKFDSLNTSLERAKKWDIIPPPTSQPSLQRQFLLAQSYDAKAASEFGKLFPKIDAFATSQMLYPDVIQVKLVNQNSFGASVSMPIFDGFRILHNVESAKQSAMMANFNYNETKINLDRDFQKSIDFLKNLDIQKEINVKDIEAAKQSAELYYESFKNGQSLLINVQNANLQVLTSEVQSARITATMLQQLYELQYLSGKTGI